VCACTWVEGSVVQIFAVILITTVTLMGEHRRSGSDVFPLSRICFNACDPALQLTGPRLREIFLCEVFCIWRNKIFRLS